MEPGQGPNLEPDLHFPGPLNSPCTARHFSSFTEQLLCAWNCAGHCEYSELDKAHTLPHEFISVELSPPGGLHGILSRKESLGPGANDQLAWDWQLSTEA